MPFSNGNQTCIYVQTTSYRRIPAGVYAHEWITEDPDTNANFWTDSLHDTILRSDNLNDAYKRVKANNGAGGVDGMKVDGLLPCLKQHRTEKVEQLRKGKYKPNPDSRVEIPKEKKGKSES